MFDFCIVPTTYPTIHNIDNSTSFSLLIEWLPPTVPNGIITHYTLYINYSNGSEIVNIIVDGQFNLYLLENLFSQQLIGVSMSASTEEGEGPNSNYILNTVRSPCKLIVNQNLTIGYFLQIFKMKLLFHLVCAVKLELECFILVFIIDTSLLKARVLTCSLMELVWYSPQYQSSKYYQLTLTSISGTIAKWTLYPTQILNVTVKLGIFI